jgi:uncharacterized protein YndB with AHSA1/START domain
MADIRNGVQIGAPQEQVFRGLITKGGFSRWWTHEGWQEPLGSRYI